MPFSIEINDGKMVFDKPDALRFVKGVSGEKTDHEGAGRLIAARLTQREKRRYGLMR